MHAAYPLSQLDAPVCSDMCSTGQEFFGTRALTCPRAFLSNRGRCKTFSRHLATRRDPVPEMVRISTTLFPSTMKYHALVVREIKYEWIAMDRSFNRVAIPNRKLSGPTIRGCLKVISASSQVQSRYRTFCERMVQTSASQANYFSTRSL